MPYPVRCLPWLGVLMCGLLQAASMAWPFQGVLAGQPQGWLQCASLAGLAYFLDRARTRSQAMGVGWLFAFAWLLGCTWWLFISLHTYGGLPTYLAAAAIGAFAAALALLYAGAAGLYEWLRRDVSCRSQKVLAFVVSWGGAELLRGHLFTGFPWGAGGYAHADSLLRHWAPVMGVYGITCLSAAVAMALAAQRRVVLQAQRQAVAVERVGVTLGVVLLLWLGWQSPSHKDAAESSFGPNFQVMLLQGNVAQDLKFGAGVTQALEDYQQALLSSTADLVVTPETAIPLLPSQLPAGYWQGLQRRYARGDQAALIGMPITVRDAQGESRYANAVLGLQPDTLAPYVYVKQHLVPFGEFVPPWFHWFVQMLNIPLGEFARGQALQAPMRWKGERIAPNICYEDLFGEELARAFRDETQAPTLLVNLSNLAWFGDTVALDQHLQISRMRALEMARPMLRATNTGATAWISAQGQVMARLPSATQGQLTVSVQGGHGPVTIYAYWVSRYGLWPLMALLMVGGAGLVAQKRLRRAPPRESGIKAT